MAIRHRNASRTEHRARIKIAKVNITNFKCSEETFSLALNDALNVIVGGSGSGKTTILEAIHLALTGMLHGRPIKNDLSSDLFSGRAGEVGRQPEDWVPPTATAITIELFLSGETSELAELEGDGNSQKVKSSGVIDRVEFDEESDKGPDEALLAAGELSCISVEYYTVTMRSFAQGDHLVKHPERVRV